MNQTDNLSKTLQNPKLSALEGQTIAKDTINALKKDRNDESFKKFWELVTSLLSRLSVGDSVLPRQRKIPVHHDQARDSYHFAETGKDHYRIIYYECIDVLVNAIEERFNLPDYQVYLNMQEILLKSFKSQQCENELNILAVEYAEDIDLTSLRGQLKLLPGIAERHRFITKDMNILDIIHFMQSLNSSESEFLSQVVVLVKLVLLAPAANAISERSFSALKT